MNWPFNYILVPSVSFPIQEVTPSISKCAHAHTCTPFSYFLSSVYRYFPWQHIVGYYLLVHLAVVFWMGSLLYVYLMTDREGIITLLTVSMCYAGTLLLSAAIFGVALVWRWHASISFSFSLYIFYRSTSTFSFVDYITFLQLHHPALNGQLQFPTKTSFTPITSLLYVIKITNHIFIFCIIDSFLVTFLSFNSCNRI